jgi:hypothetical protein
MEQPVPADPAETFGVKRIDRSASAAHQLFNQVKVGGADAIDTVKDGAMDAHDTVRELIETRPYASALGAFAIGWFIGHLGTSRWTEPPY